MVVHVWVFLERYHVFLDRMLVSNAVRFVEMVEEFDEGSAVVHQLVSFSESAVIGFVNAFQLLDLE